MIDKSGVVRRVFAKVKVNGHTDEVIEALKAIDSNERMIRCENEIAKCLPLTYF